MNCKNCGKQIEVVLDEDDSNFGDAIHRDGFFSCRLNLAVPMLAEFSDSDLSMLTRALEIRQFHEAHINA